MNYGALNHDLGAEAGSHNAEELEQWITTMSAGGGELVTLDGLFGDVPSEGEQDARMAEAARYLRWVHPQDQSAVTVCYKPSDGGFDGCTLPTVGKAVMGVEKCAEAGADAVWVTVHKAGANVGTGKKPTIDQMAAFQFLAIDIDNVPAVKKTCATAEERGRVGSVADTIKSALTGLPTPADIDTGNGRLLLYPIDLPNTSHNKTMMERLGRALAATYGTPHADIDTAVIADPSRILGVPGTLNRNKAERPEEGRVARYRTILGTLPDRSPMTAESFLAWAETFIAENLLDSDDIETVMLATAPKPVTPKEQTPTPLPATDDQTRAVLLRHASAYLEKCASAVEGDGGDKHTYNTAGHLLSFRYRGMGLSVADVHTLMFDSAWNARCSPPWPSDELWDKVRSASRNGTPRPVKEIKEGDGGRSYVDGWIDSPTLSTMNADSVPADGPIIVNLATVTPAETDWLWKDKIVQGGVNIVYGDSDQGKSLVTLDMAARITTGAPWPDGGTAPLGRVILMGTEDNLATTVVPRLTAAGADVARVVALQGRREKGKERAVTLRHIDTIRDTIRKTTDCRLVVIDPIGSFMGDKDSYKDADVRDVIGPLTKIAEEFGVAVVLVGHTGKGERRSAKSKIMGSAAFVNLPRSALFVQTDPSDKGRRLIHPTKGNLTAERRGMAYRIVGVPVMGLNATAARIEWEQGTVTISADEALAMGEDREGASKIEEAKDLITEVLQGQGWVDSKQVQRRADEAGISWRTLNRAKGQLGVKAERVGFGEKGRWVWNLPTQTDGAEAVMAEERS